MEKISACLVVYNEEKLIARCLDSLHGIVDEIILVHDGECQDKTLEIAEKYGAKVFIRPHVGGAEEHRPFSWEQAQYNWILQIDADEYLSDDLKNNLRSLVSADDISAYELLWPLWDGKKENKARWPYKRCLFRKDKISYLGILQAVAIAHGTVKKIDLKLEHRPDYNNYSYSSFLKKQLPWAHLQAAYYLQDFSEIKKFNSFLIEWPMLIKWRKNVPLMMIPAEFAVTFIKNIVSGAYRAGWLGIKLSFQTAVYRAMVNYYIYKGKK